MELRRILVGSAVVLAMLGTDALGAMALRPSLFDEPSTVKVLGTPSRDERLPVLVFLPATSGTAEEIHASLAAYLPLDRYVAVLPAGRPERSDYLPRFGDFVTAVDARVTADLERVRAEHPIDADRIYLLGYSLGGDTSWALLLRHPDVFRGALVLGSRSSAVARGRTFATLRARSARVAFAMGRNDDPARVAGITRAFGATRAASVAAELFFFDGDHQLPGDDTLPRALGFLFGE